jgi:hypothetical protein
VPPGKEIYGTTVDALDEATTLGLAMRSFDLDWKADHPNARLFKVLLAQMTRGKAETLSANLANSNFSNTSERFDLVISAAADFSAATANETLALDRPQKPLVKTIAEPQGADQAAVFAQEEPGGGVQGTLKDPGGAVVDNASVTVTTTTPEDSKSLETKTDKNGHYRFDLAPGVYRLTVKAQGFTELKHEGINVEIGHLLTSDLTLSKLPEFRHFVVVPWLGYDSSGHRPPNPIRSVTLTDSNPSPQPQPRDTRTFVVGGHYEQWFPLSESVNQDKLQACYNIIARDFLKDQKHYWREQLPPPTGNNNEPDCSKVSTTDDPKPLAPKLTGAFELAVLAALRDRTHADVAMLQKRSFYWGPFPSPLDKKASLAQPNGELLDRILWQGDFLKVLAVKGSTLKKVLDESDKLDALDEQATNEVVETKRGLLALGIEKTRDKQYLVDGMQLDANRLYTVATSNHIAAGDNGYPELVADPQLLDARLPTGKEDTPRISWVACEALKDSQVNRGCEPRSGLSFASIQNPTPLPPQLEPPLTAFAKAYKHSVFGNPDLRRDTFSRTNYEAQLVPTWRISLNDFSFNLSSVRNNLTEPQRLTELGGVTEPLAGNAKSHSINFSTHEEWVRSGKWTDEFLRGMFQFQDTATGNTLPVPILSAGTLVNTLAPAPALTTYLQNQGAIDLGIFWHPGAPWHLSPHKYFTKFGFVFEPLTHFDTQLASQDLIFPPVPDPTGSGKILVPEIPIDLPFNQNWLGRFGFRGESNKSHLEIGYQGGWELKALETVSSNLGSCPPVSITLCVQSWELQPAFVPGSISQARDRRQRTAPTWTWTGVGRSSGA